MTFSRTAPALLAGIVGAMAPQGSTAQGVEQSPVTWTVPINVRDHGATGDGTTDDTRSLVDLFTKACASGGGTNYVPAGIYIIDPGSTSIPICGNLVVQGTGTLRVKPDSGNYRYIFAANPPGEAVDNLTFTGLTIDQNAMANTTGAISIDDTRTWQ